MSFDRRSAGHYWGKAFGQEYASKNASHRSGGESGANECSAFFNSQWDLKIDHDFSERHRVVGRISWWNVDNRNTPTLSGVDYDNPNPADTGLYTVPRRSYQPMLSYT